MRTKPPRRPPVTLHTRHGATFTLSEIQGREEFALLASSNAQLRLAVVLTYADVANLGYELLKLAADTDPTVQYFGKDSTCPTSTNSERPSRSTRRHRRHKSKKPSNE